MVGKNLKEMLAQQSKLKIKGDKFYQNLINLHSYLKGGTLMDEMSLDDEQKLFFHWADCQETCLLERSEVGATPRGKARFDGLLIDLTLLKDSPTWVRGPYNTLHSNLFEIYEHFVDMPFRRTLDAGKDLLISTCSQAGPYVPLMSHRWQDKNIFKEFILKKILTKKMPLRHFRLRTNLNASVYFKGPDIDLFDVKIAQIMPTGLLFRWKSPVLRAKMTESAKIFFNIDLNQLGHLFELPKEGNNSLRFWAHTMRFFGPSSNSHSAGHDQEEFLFVRYSDMRDTLTTQTEQNKENLLEVNQATQVFLPLVEKYYLEIRKATEYLSRGLKIQYPHVA